MKRYAIYARYSSDRQAETSVDDQIALCRRHVDSLEGCVVDTFSDYAISGANSDRPGLNNLMMAAQAGQFDYVVAEALDRLSRDQENIAGVYKRLTHWGVQIVTLSEGNVSELHIGLKGTMNALFLKDLAAKTKRGQIGAVERGKIPGSLSYGYEAIRTEFDSKGEMIRGLRRVKEDEAAIVQRIFEEFASGRSPKAIAKSLNADGVPSPRGQGWRTNTIYGNAKRGNGVLHNRLYTGQIVYNRQSFFRDPETGKRTARLNPQSAWTIQAVPELRIVPDELWDAAHAALKVVTHSNDKKRPKRVLSGLVTCGECGGSFVGRGLGRLGCSNRAEKGTCGNKVHVLMDEVEGRVFTALSGLLLDADLVQIYVKEYLAEMARLQNTAGKQRRRLERQYTKVSNDVEKAVDAFIQSPKSSHLKNRLEELEDTKERLKAEIAAIGNATPVAIGPGIAESYRRKVNELAELVASEDLNGTEAQAAIRKLVGKVTISNTKTEQGRPGIELEGDLAAILAFANGDPKLMGNRMEAMVAGIGFEPMTFRL